MTPSTAPELQRAAPDQRRQETRDRVPSVDDRRQRRRDQRIAAAAEAGWLLALR